MALLLVDLHRNGIYWGDCSLANTLFMRDGQTIQAWMVDAETAEFHPTLTRRPATDGPRDHGRERRRWSARCRRPSRGATRGVRRDHRRGAQRRRPLRPASGRSSTMNRWSDYGDRRRDRITPARASTTSASRSTRFGSSPRATPSESLRMKVAVAGRTFHSERLRSLTGLSRGRGPGHHPHERPSLVPQLAPARAGRRRSRGAGGTPVADRRVRADVGAGLRGGRPPRRSDPGLLRPPRGPVAAQRGRRATTSATRPRLRRSPTESIPDDSAATISFVETPTAELPERRRRAAR